MEDCTVFRVCDTCWHDPKSSSVTLFSFKYFFPTFCLNFRAKVESIVPFCMVLFTFQFSKAFNKQIKPKTYILTVRFFLIALFFFSYYNWFYRHSLAEELKLGVFFLPLTTHDCFLYFKYDTSLRGKSVRFKFSRFQNTLQKHSHTL